MSVNLTTNTSYAEAIPALSILVPFYHDDASELIAALDILPTNAASVEILIYDDGTNDTALTDKIRSVVRGATRPAALLSNATNLGRSAARNALQAAARAPWILFLDADMLPGSDDFVQTYLNLIGENTADIIFGGFTVQEVASDPDRDLHRALSAVSDCLDAAARAQAGPQFVASSNLCVRKSLIEAEPFDDGFSGWGWEDSEWAARVAQGYTLIHADNPAVHLGLESTDTLLKRFATSGANYVRFTQRHPELAASLALFRISHRLRRLPGQRLMRPVLRTLVKTYALPMRLRLAALKLWRASHYAESLS